MQSLVHTSQSWSAPVTRLWVGGGVELRQRVPLPATGRVEQYNTSLFNASSSFAADYDISNILSRYNARNGELVVIVLGFTQHTMASLQPCSQAFASAQSSLLHLQYVKMEVVEKGLGDLVKCIR